ncbi:MAG: YebC/PmpR family DNA-binding transcriptional regulator [Candidatus Pacebacteria bacterium]|nr:YebC/PmpR family DNA-binding transcriptional regulator [Candidatus Paceibacterota bacterium]
MAGHSHWHSIRYKKEIEDKKRAKIFSKIARQILIAAREGKNSETNPKLRMAIERAKEFNMPNERIERAIKRGAGEIEGEKLEEVIFECLGPGNVAIILEGITDNKNRTLSEIKQILQKEGGKLAEEGSLRWQFKRMGVIKINIKDQQKKPQDIELLSIDLGAQDLKYRNSFLEIYTLPENLEEIKNKLEEEGIIIESSQPEWVPEHEIEVSEKDKEACKKLFLTLDENDAIQEIYSNLKL